MAESNDESGDCSICERSMLAGERTRTYLTRDREEREVCDLCLVRAESAGWVAAELAGAHAPEGGREGGGAMRRLFGRARTREAQPRRDPAPTRRTRVAREPEEEPAPDDEPAPVGAPTEAPPRRRSVPQNPERRIRRAFESFNASSHRRTVRGLIRSLGGPYVAAVTTSDSPGEVRITVAWELSWYQWEVDLTSADQAVRELGHGEELAQLSAADQGWNAHAAEDGELRYGLIGESS